MEVPKRGPGADRNCYGRARRACIASLVGRPFVRQSLSLAKRPIATVTGNYRLTAEDAPADIRHIVLEFGNRVFPVLEGQTLGIVPPGLDQNGRPHFVRLYSVSPRRFTTRT